MLNMLQENSLKVFSWAGGIAQLEERLQSTGEVEHAVGHKASHVIAPMAQVQPAACGPATSRKRYYVLEPLGVWVKRGRVCSDTLIGPTSDDDLAPSPPAAREPQIDVCTTSAPTINSISCTSAPSTVSLPAVTAATASVSAIISGGREFAAGLEPPTHGVAAASPRHPVYGAMAACLQRTWSAPSPAFFAARDSNSYFNKNMVFSRQVSTPDGFACAPAATRACSPHVYPRHYPQPQLQPQLQPHRTVAEAATSSISGDGGDDCSGSFVKAESLVPSSGSYGPTAFLCTTAPLSPVTGVSRPARTCQPPDRSLDCCQGSYNSGVVPVRHMTGAATSDSAAAAREVVAPATAAAGGGGVVGGCDSRAFDRCDSGDLDSPIDWSRAPSVELMTPGYAVGVAAPLAPPPSPQVPAVSGGGRSPDRQPSYPARPAMVQATLSPCRAMSMPVPMTHPTPVGSMPKGPSMPRYPSMALSMPVAMMVSSGPLPMPTPFNCGALLLAGPPPVVGPTLMEAAGLGLARSAAAPPPAPRGAVLTPSLPFPKAILPGPTASSVPPPMLAPAPTPSAPSYMPPPPPQIPPLYESLEHPPPPRQQYQRQMAFAHQVADAGDAVASGDGCLSSVQPHGAPYNGDVQDDEGVLPSLLDLTGLDVLPGPAEQADHLPL